MKGGRGGGEGTISNLKKNPPFFNRTPSLCLRLYTTKQSITFTMTNIKQVAGEL